MAGPPSSHQRKMTPEQLEARLQEVETALIEIHGSPAAVAEGLRHRFGDRAAGLFLARQERKQSSLRAPLKSPGRPI